MIYSDAENKRWWQTLGKTGQAELLDKIEEKASSEVLQSMARDIREDEGTPTAYQLSLLRKWA